MRGMSVGKLIVAAAVMILGCRDKSAPAPAGTGSGTTGSGSQAQVAAPRESTVSACSRRDPTSPVECRDVPLHVSATTLARLLPPKPGLPIPLRNLHLRAPRDQQKGVPPEAFDNWVPPEFPDAVVSVGTRIEVSDDGPAVHYVMSGIVFLPRISARALVAGVWGEPTTSGGKTAWINTQDGYQAVLVDDLNDPSVATLVVRPYVTLEHVIGDSADHFGFEPKNQLGATIDEVMSGLPSELRPSKEHETHGMGGISITLPPIELADDDTSAHYATEDGHVTTVSLHVPRTPEVTQRAAAAVVRKGSLFHLEDNSRDSIAIFESR
jgi:hypothetical protein